MRLPRFPLHFRWFACPWSAQAWPAPPRRLTSQDRRSRPPVPETGCKRAQASRDHQCVAALNRRYLLRAQSLDIPFEGAAQLDRDGLKLLPNLADDPYLVRLGEFGRSAGDANSFE